MIDSCCWKVHKRDPVNGNENEQSINQPASNEQPTKHKSKSINDSSFSSQTNQPQATITNQAMSSTTPITSRGSWRKSLPMIIRRASSESTGSASQSSDNPLFEESNCDNNKEPRSASSMSKVRSLLSKRSSLSAMLRRRTSNNSTGSSNGLSETEIAAGSANPIYQEQENAINADSASSSVEIEVNQSSSSFSTSSSRSSAHRSFSGRNRGRSSTTNPRFIAAAEEAAATSKNDVNTGLLSHKSSSATNPLCEMQDDNLDMSSKTLSRAASKFSQVKSGATKSLIRSASRMYNNKRASLPFRSSVGRIGTKDSKRFNKINAKCLGALHNLKTEYGPDHSQVSAAESRLGQLFKSQGKFEQAEIMFVDVLRIEILKVGTDHVSIAVVKSLLGDVYTDLEQFSKAETMYQDTLRIYKAVHGSDNVQVGATCFKLGRVYDGLNNVEAAEAMYLQAVRVFKVQKGSDHVQVTAATVFMLGVLYQKTSDFEQAVTMFLDAKQLYHSVHGPDHPQIAVVEYTLAILYQDIEDFVQAEEMYLDSLRILKATRGDNHPEVLTVQTLLDSLYIAKPGEPGI